MKMRDFPRRWRKCLVISNLESKSMFKRVVIIGFGLIGGSIALSIKKNRLAKELIAWDIDQDCLRKGAELKIIDGFAETINKASAGADLIVLSVPVGEMRGVLEQIDLEDQIITDVGSVKGAFVKAVEEVFTKVPPRLIPGHPIAGSEKKGFGASEANLFEGHSVILTPNEESDKTALEKVAKLWSLMGCKISFMSAQDHDTILAKTSHLPHLLSSVISESMYDEPDRSSALAHAAGSFRDMSRVSASDPAIWADIFLANDLRLIESLERFLVGLEKMKNEIAAGNYSEVKSFLERGKSVRDHFSSITKEL